MGIASLFNSTLNLIFSLSSLGLDKSGVRDIAAADLPENGGNVSRTIQILRKLVFASALLGAVVMVIFSSLLSEFAFGDKSYSWGFVWLALALIFKQLTSGQLAILQGLRKLKYLAKANLWGSFLGLVATLPLYYFFGIKGIVPAIIIATIISFILTLYFSNKIAKGKESITIKEAFREGKPMVNLGIMLSISGIVTLLAAYLVQIYISQSGTVSQVGLYNAGFVILNSYVGLIFNAMATDYFPRLSAIATEIVKVRRTVYEQAFIAILLITPIIILFLIFAPYIIFLLYSREFIPIIGLVSWGILGMVFKAVSFSMGYIIIAKGDSKLFIRTAIGFNIIMITGNILGYYYLGLTGLGISFFIYYIVHFAILKTITYKRYQFYFEKGFYLVFSICAIACILAFILTYITNDYLKYGALGCLLIFSCVYSFYQLDKQLDMKDMFKNYFNSKK